MRARRAKKHTGYTSQERQVLLTGVPLTHLSTRFGHPKTGWHRDEIATAWAALEAELLPLWDAGVFPFDHKRHDRPFAERFLAQDSDTYPFRQGR